MSDATTGSFVWYDLLTPSTKDAVPFYTYVLGWSAQPWERGYTTWVGSQGPLGDTVKLPWWVSKIGVPPHWTSNVQVVDVDTTVAQVRKLGGRVYVPPADVPKVGRFAVIADLQGAPINVFKPAEPIKLHDTTKPGEFVWHELVTTDHESAFTFYSKLFGWTKVHDFDLGPTGKYVIYGVDGKALGGMFTKAKDIALPPMWFYYVYVSDLDATLGRAKVKGARVLNGPMGVPGGARIAQLVDPQGAAFALYEAAKSA